MNNSRLMQIKVYVGKHYRLFVSDKGWKVLIFAAIIAGMVSPILGNYMFVRNTSTASGCFALVSASVWIGIFNSIESICKERPIIKREHRTGLHISAYVISHMIFQFFICIVEALEILAISASFLNYSLQTTLFIHTYVEYFITFFLLIYGADVLGLAISAIVPNAETAMTVMPFVLIVQLMFSGMLFSLSGFALKIGDFTLSKWGLNACCISADYNNLELTEKVRVRNYLYRAAQKHDITLTSDQLDVLAVECLPDTVNTTYTYTTGNLVKQWRTGLIHIAVYGAIAIAALEFIDKDKR